MKIKSSGISSGSTPSTPTSTSAATAAKVYADAASPHKVKDTISIMGIPETELTPKVRQAIMTLMQEVDTLRQSVESLNDRLAAAEKLADRDPLLPIYNRRAFVRELTRAQASAERYNSEASLVYIDLDNFKAVNDTYGHRSGDHVLQELSLRLVSSVRDTDIVGRLGGDEFGLILSRTNQESAAILANRLELELKNDPITWNGIPLPVGMSYGIVTIEPDRDAQDTMDLADGRMYQHKKKAKGS